MTTIMYGGFKSDGVDELLDEYDICFDQPRRIQIIQEIDGIFGEVHPIAFSIARNYSRMMCGTNLDTLNGCYPDTLENTGMLFTTGGLMIKKLGN